MCVGVWKADPTIYARSRRIVSRDFFTATVLLEMFHKSAPLSYYGLRNAGYCKAASFNGCGHFRARPRGSPRGQTSVRVCHARCLATRRVLQNAKIGATGRKINVKNFPRQRSQILCLRTDRAGYKGASRSVKHLAARPPGWYRFWYRGAATTISSRLFPPLLLRVQTPPKLPHILP